MNGDTPTISWVRSNWPGVIFVLTLAVAVGAYQVRIKAMEDRQLEGAAERAQLRSQLVEIRGAQATTAEALQTIKAQQNEMTHDIKDILTALDGAVRTHRRPNEP